MLDDWSKPKDAFAAVPLFPLPNVVLLPRAMLPLHIFEERYKAMTADALRGNQLIAMALLKPGWEKHYYQRPALEQVVCVGRILSHEKLSDGKYNFLLQGLERARIVDELGDREYRRARLQAIEDVVAPESELAMERGAIKALLEEEPWATVPISRQFRQMVAGPFTTPMIADLLAFNLLDDVALKQSLLADGDQANRVRRVIGAMAMYRARFPAEPSMN